MIYNFSSGPSMLPTIVKERLYHAMTDYQQSGMGIMEISHRSEAFAAVMLEIEIKVRQLLEVPEHYKILLMAGGATHQFSLLPMNLCANGSTACYSTTGAWAEKALIHATKLCTTYEIASSRDSAYTYIPDVDISKMDSNEAYLHITSNNTVYGAQYHSFPDSPIPLIADMTSDIFSRVIDVSQFGMIYAGAQKNLGLSGLTLVIIREDLLDRSPDELPDLFSYKKIAESGSLYNTPPTLSIYTLLLMLEWIDEQGGVRQLERINHQKAALLYEAIDNSSIFYNQVQAQYRSRMNVVFTSGDAHIDKQFAKQAASQGLMSIEGHRISGGLRAAIYNAMPLEGVEGLVQMIANRK